MIAIENAGGDQPIFDRGRSVFGLARIFQTKIS
jgi:hypothetical protein